VRAVLQSVGYSVEAAMEHRTSADLEGFAAGTVFLSMVI
jgi:hypothetical protein